MRRLLIPSALLIITACAGTSSAGTTSVAAHAAKSVDVKTPRLVGLSLPDARAAVAQRDLSIGRVRHQSSGKPQHQIVKQFPPAGIYLRRGQPVDITISTGSSRR